MKFTFPKIITVLLIALSLPNSVAFADSREEALELARTVYKGVDQNNRGFIDLEQVHELRNDIFVSIDSDDSNSIELEEFSSWSFGMREIAEDAGRLDEYMAALKLVFAIWDRDGNGRIGTTEYRKATLLDFMRADTNGNERISEDEFIDGFIMTAIGSVVFP